MDVARVIDVLGLGGEVRSEPEFVRRVEHGLPAAAIAAVQRLAGLSDAEVAQIVPRTTLARARRCGTLRREQSDRIARAAAIYLLAHDTFGSVDRANDWMQRPNTALRGAIPLSLLRTSSGAKLVEQTLGRIAYGVFA